jgi:hypothetical protein
MELAQQLADFKAEFLRTAPAGRPALYEVKIEELRAGFALKAAVGVEARAPDFRLPDVRGTLSPSPICSQEARLCLPSIGGPVPLPQYLVHRFHGTDLLWPVPEGPPHAVVCRERKHDGWIGWQHLGG